MSFLKLSQNWSNLIKPSKLSAEAVDGNPNATKFVIMPLERGFGVTLGNALRRVLLSSLQGTSIIGVKVHGVDHEFASIPNVKEDMVNLILNLKSVVLRTTSNDNRVIRLNKTGPCIVTAGMIETDNLVEVINPDHVICHLSPGAVMDMELYYSSGKGYGVSSSFNNFDLPADVIKIDALFNPVSQVSFNVDHTRIGQITDYDRLTLRIETNGSLTPEFAIGIAAKIMQDQLQLFVNFDFVEEDTPAKTDNLPYNPILLKKIEELELSVRAQNCLKDENIVYIGDLVVKTEADMLKTRNFGKKSLNELKDILSTMNLNLGMKVNGWPSSNIEELSKKYEQL